MTYYEPSYSQATVWPAEGKLAENPEAFALSQADTSTLLAEVRRRMTVGAR